jgi:hypothetical protein
MKTIRQSLVFGLLLVATNPALSAAPTAEAVDFGSLPPPSAGGELVEVNIRSNLIAMAARLAEKSEPQVAELLRGLHAIHVNLVGLDSGNRTEVEKRINTLRSALDAQGWERIVTAQKNSGDVGVYLKTRGEEAVQGLVVTVLEGNKQAVVVRINGNIRPEQVALLGDRFNIEPLKRIGGDLKK